MGLNLGLAVEQVLLDFSQVTYLSSRAMRQQADATANVAKDRFERKKLRRVLPWWIDRMAAMGEIPSGPEDRYAHEWIYAPRGWIDPDKDLKAALIELDMGLTTMEILAKERGREFAELVAKRSAEIKAMKTADIPVVMSSQTREMGAVAGAPPTDETPQEEMPQEEETPQEDTEE
jgi:capsid protein